MSLHRPTSPNLFPNSSPQKQQSVRENTPIPERFPLKTTFRSGKHPYSRIDSLFTTVVFLKGKIFTHTLNFFFFRKGVSKNICNIVSEEH